jgi:hypothetical protein
MDERLSFLKDNFQIATRRCSGFISKSYEEIIGLRPVKRDFNVIPSCLQVM